MQCNTKQYNTIQYNKIQYNTISFLTQAEAPANTSAQLTLEEQRAIEEEARKTGVEEAEAKVQEQRKSQTEASTGSGGQDGAVAGPPGRDSGFSSEQDQKQKQQEQQSQEVSLWDSIFVLSYLSRLRF